MRLIILFGAVLSAASCAGRTELTPAPQIGQIAPNAVQAVTSGVTMIVRTDAWLGTPPEITEVIPLQATIDNGSSRPLRVRYREFALVTDTERRVPALPPFDIRGTESVPVGTAGTPIAVYAYPCNGFLVAPYLHAYYPVFPPYTGPFAYDPLFYSTYYPAFVRIALPAGDMVQKALPEGVLEPGGRITGFLYFEDLDDPNTVRFRADLVDASTGIQFGTIEIPFRVD